MTKRSGVWMLVGIAALTLATALSAAARASAGEGEEGNGTGGAAVEPLPAEPIVAAVLGFQCRDAELGGAITDAVMGALSDDPAIGLVERDQLDAALREHQIGLSGLVSASDAARIGFLVGAKALIMGRAFVIDRKIMITGKIVGVETGRVFVEQVEGDQAKDLLPVAMGLGEKMAATIKARWDRLCGPDIGSEKEKRITDLVEELKGKELPQVAISVPEVHFGQPVNDPAAKTELIYWFSKCGFTVIDPGDKESRLADWAYRYYHSRESGAEDPLTRLIGEDVNVVIVGEAFSEFATQVGPLTSCKVRVEVRALERGTGRVLAISRRSQASVDVSELAAAKSGLQRAAANIAYELIRQLVPEEEKPE